MGRKNEDAEFMTLRVPETEMWGMRMGETGTKFPKLMVDIYDSRRCRRRDWRATKSVGRCCDVGTDHGGSTGSPCSLVT